MEDDDIKLTKALGFNDILNMPFNKEEAAELVKSMIAREDNLDPVEKKLRKIEGVDKTRTLVVLDEV